METQRRIGGSSVAEPTRSHGVQIATGKELGTDSPSATPAASGSCSRANCGAEHRLSDEFEAALARRSGETPWAPLHVRPEHGMY